MKQSEIKILVVEDDNTLGRAMQEALKRTGYEVRWATTPDEALSASRQIDFSLVIVDCLLPKTNGIELTQKLKSHLGNSLKTILISGIYKDKNFSKEALQKTQSLAFLIKPFDLEKLLQLVHENFADQLDEEMPPLLNSLTMTDLSPTHRLEILQNGSSLHGFDLPLIYSILFHSHLSGHLTITTSDANKSTLVFQSGKLIQVLLHDQTSYFGVLLVEMGFTTSEEVNHVLHDDRNRNPIGERLVAAHSLSPHAIRVVREEQMLIRLSKTVQDSFIDVTFTPNEEKPSDVTLNRDRFSQLLWDWICSKMAPDWLTDFYNKWLDYPFILHEDSVLRRRLSLISSLQDIVDPFLVLLKEGKTLDELLQINGLQENKLFQILHFLLLEKLAHFGGRRASQEDIARKIARLKRMIQETSERDFFHTLGVTPKVSDHVLNKNYVDLAKAYHPDRLDPGAPKELRHLTEQYFARITEAYDTLKDSEKRKAYAREQNEGSADKIMQRETIFEQGHGYLLKGKYQQALKIFHQLAQQRHARADIHIYLTWAMIKAGPGDQKIDKFLNLAGETLNKVPPEERHSSPFFYTKGLFYMQLGDLEKSKTNFKHALAIDPNFVEARRDLTIVRSQLREQGTSDFSTVVTSLLSGKRRAK